MTTPYTPPGPIVFFGDSLSDTGNLYAIGEGLVDDDLRNSLGGPGGRISDGPVAVEYAAELLGAQGVYNYAIAGAQAAGSYTLGAFAVDAGFEDDLLVPLDDPALAFDINLGAQIDRFLGDFDGQDISDLTAFILIGGNDYGGLDLSNPATLIQDALAALAAVIHDSFAAVAELSLAGVGSVVICTLPNALFFPAARSGDPVEEALTELFFNIHNAVLSAGAEALARSGVDVTVLDLAAMTRAISEDPTAFGLIAPYGETLREGDPGVIGAVDADQVAFWDPIHPTTATHGVLGSFIAHAMVHEVTVLDDGANLSFADTGADLVLGYGAADTILTGGAADIVIAGTGDDNALGGTGDDLLNGGSGADRLNGGQGADILGGAEGDDLLLGRTGDDVLICGSGADTARGGWGDDTFIFIEPELIGGGAPGGVLSGGAGSDTLYLVLGSESFAAYGTDPSAALTALGLESCGIEEVVVLDGRTALGALSDMAWFEAADLWGLI